MLALPRIRMCFPAGALALTLCSTCLLAQKVPPEVKAASQTSATNRDGQHDFDWDIGTWKVHQRRLLHPQTGSTTWIEYDGTDVVQRLWDGANIAKVESTGPAGRLELFSIRIYNPGTRKWSVYFAGNGSGTLSVPAVGEFRNGQGEFYDQENINGKATLVRFRVSDITTDSCSFDQAFSPDGGKTWETNLIVRETRVKGAS